MSKCMKCGKPIRNNRSICSFCDGYMCGYEKGKADAIDECTDKFADILSNMKQICGRNCPVNCNWGTSESCKSMIKKWLLEQLKEQNK